jgi:hypothetical protein
VTSCARCAGDENPDTTTSFGHGGGGLIPCGNFWFPLPFLIEKGIVFVTFHRERTIGRPSPKYLVVADAACAAISSHMLLAGLNSEAHETRHRVPASLATSKLPTPNPASLATSIALTLQIHQPCDQQVQSTRARPECSIHASREGQQDRGTEQASRFGDAARVLTPGVHCCTFLSIGREIGFPRFRRERDHQHSMP